MRVDHVHCRRSFPEAAGTFLIPLSLRHQWGDGRCASDDQSRV